MKGRIFLSVFALPFFGVGVWMGWSIGATFVDAARMAAWVPVPATVVSAGYETHSDDGSDTYKAWADYRYEYDGRTYRGNRVAIAGSGDNIGSFQRDLGRRLGDAAAHATPVTVYVDPDEPATSVIDRSVRWGLTGFKAIFVLVFGGVGGGMLFAAWRQPQEEDPADPRFADTPWLLDDAWQTPTIRSSSKASMIGVWLFAAIWNLISAPLPFLIYEEVVDKHNTLALVGLLFTLVGIGMIVWAIRRTLEWKRFGPTPVTLDPFPGSIGGHVGGTIDLKLPFDSRHEFELTLTNLQSSVSGSGKNRSRSERAEWQDTIVAHTESNSTGGTRLTFRFDVPGGLHESDAKRDDTWYAWRLNLSAELDGADLDRSFDIPVYATGQTSRSLSRLALERGRDKLAARADAAVRRAIRLVHDGAGRRMVYPMGRNLGPSLGGFLVGAMFAAAGGWLVVHEGQRVFGSIFGGIGALVALATLYAMFNSLEVARESGGFRTVRRWLGIPVRRRRMGRHEFAHFTKSSNFQTQGGGKYVMHYSIYAVDVSGHRLVVGEGFKGESEAAAAMRFIAEELGLSGHDKRNGGTDTTANWDPAGLISG